MNDNAVTLYNMKTTYKMKYYECLPSLYIQEDFQYLQSTLADMYITMQ